MWDVVEQRARVVIGAVQRQRDAPRCSRVRNGLLYVDGERPRRDGGNLSRELVELRAARAVLDAGV